MNIEHLVGLSWFHASTDAKTKRPCARLRDAERESVAVPASGDPAMVLMFRMASILPMVRASCPLSPSRRIAAGHAARTSQSPRAKTRARGARKLYSTTNVVLFEQRLVTRLVLALDVVEKRTACCDHFQKAPPPM